MKFLTILVFFAGVNAMAIGLHDHGIDAAFSSTREMKKFTCRAFGSVNVVVKEGNSDVVTSQVTNIKTDLIAKDATSALTAFYASVAIRFVDKLQFSTSIDTSELIAECFVK